MKKQILMNYLQTCGFIHLYPLPVHGFSWDKNMEVQL